MYLASHGAWEPEGSRAVLRGTGEVIPSSHSCAVARIEMK